MVARATISDYFTWTRILDSGILGFWTRIRILGFWDSGILDSDPGFWTPDSGILDSDSGFLYKAALAAVYGLQARKGSVRFPARAGKLCFSNRRQAGSSLESIKSTT